MNNVDVLIVGAGVVGLAIGARLSQRFDQVIVVDEQPQFGGGISSRNSEVIHAGIYYPKDSLKAKLCVRGKQLLYEYCLQNHVSFNRIGKLIVATSPDELPTLDQNEAKAKENGVYDLQWLSSSQISQMEPELNAHSALFSPSTGIIDSHGFMFQLLAQLESNNGQFVGLTEFLGAEPNCNGFSVSLSAQGEPFKLNSRLLINAGGLSAQSIAKSIHGLSSQVIPTLHLCKGHYFSYQGKHAFQHLIYPVPEPNTVGLGIHATLDLAGQLKFGPDTLYVETLDFNVPVQRHSSFAKAIRRYWPNVKVDRLQPSYSGIRPKLHGKQESTADFRIDGDEVHSIEGLINLFGVESPGLTSSLAIAEYIDELLA